MFTTSSAGVAAPVARAATRQGLRSPAKRSGQLPPAIGAAIATINIDPLFRDLSLTARNVLMFLVQVTNARDPLAPSWAFKETVAEYLGVGEATVYRMLNVLIENGLIERLPQERKSRNGRFAVARIRLTTECCVRLGLLRRAASQKSGQHIEDNRDVNANEDSEIRGPKTVCVAATSHTDASAVRVQSPRGGQSSGTRVGPPTKMIDGYMNILPTADQQTQSSKQSRPVGGHKPAPGQPYLRVPSEFFWLIEENRLTGPQVCKLMREFSTRGQRLGDAVSVLADRLRQLPKNNTYAYLAALAKGPTDFKWRRKEQEKAVQADRKKEAVRETTASLQDMAGKYLFSTKQTHLFLLRGGHAEAWWLDGGALRRGSQPVNADFVDAYSSGRLSLVSPERATEILAVWGKLN